MHRIAEKTNSQVITFWDYDSSKLLVQPSGLLNAILSAVVRLLSKRSGTLARGIYGILGTYFYKMNKTDLVTFVSSSYIPIPRGKHVLAYIHTPSRMLTINFKRKLENETRPMHRLFLLIWKKIYFYFYGRSLKRAHMILVNSKNVQGRLKEYFHIDSTILYPSQDVESFSCSKFENYFFYPSRISPDKRQKIAIEAFRLFNEKDRNFRLVLASTPLKSKENQNYLRELMEMVKTYSLPVEIKIGLSREEIIALYSGCYTCIFTAHDEDLGQVPIEAMASSKPVVAIDEGGVRETVIDGVTGFLVQDASAMANQLMLLANDIELAKKLGQNGRRMAVERFSDDKFIDNLNRQLEKLMPRNTKD